MKTVLITGAYRGLGYEVARQLSERGWKVILTARRTDQGSAAAAKLKNASFHISQRGPPGADAVYAPLSKGNAIEEPEKVTAVTGDAPRRSCRKHHSTWNILIQQRGKLAGKRSQPRLCGVGCFARPQGRSYADQRAVTAAKPNGVRHQVELCPVFAGHGTIMRQIPIEH